jgi:hypothetical protein
LTHELSVEERQQGEVALARILPKVARLSVTTRPAGAALYLDRKNLGQYGLTPRSIAAAPGKHTVILTLAGHRAVEREVEMVRGLETRVEVELFPLEGRVHVRSTPEGANVALDGGGVLGVTPVEVSLPIGPRRLLISRTGHEPALREVTIKETELASLEVSLTPLPPPRGRLRVLSNIPSALVSVDDKEAGFTPLLIDLEAGEHRVSVYQPGYRPLVQVAEIAADKILALEVTLEAEQQATGRGPWPWVLLTTSAASGVVGLGLGARALGVAGEYERNPTRELYESGRSLNVAADVMLGIAVLGGAATTALFLFGEDLEERDSSAKVEVR